MGPKGETERTKELDNLPLAQYSIYSILLLMLALVSHPFDEIVIVGVDFLRFFFRVYIIYVLYIYIRFIRLPSVVYMVHSLIKPNPSIV
jgi:hypothetical protein